LGSLELGILDMGVVLMKNYQLASLIVVTGFLIIIGYLCGSTYPLDITRYQGASIMTCNYANNLTDVINMQSDTLNLYTGTNYTKLDKLNCSLLE